MLREHGSQIKSTNSIDTDFLKSLNVPLLSKALDRSPSAFLEAQDYAEDRISAANRLGLCVTHPLADNYPRRLRLRESFPSLLFVRGDIRALDGDKQVAIVGTRAPTDYGHQMAQGVSGQLASQGYTVVSGLALGCDTAAHQGALASDGLTVAVLSTPVEGAVYPLENQGLADRIAETGGALVSEYEPGAYPRGRSFAANLIARDEWQPALSDGLIAAEASSTGGTNHAVRHALNSGLPVGVFDYGSRLSPAALGAQWYSGNRVYLEDPRVSPLFSRESVTEFERNMDHHRAERKLGVHNVDENTPSASSPTQPQLF